MIRVLITSIGSLGLCVSMCGCASEPTNSSDPPTGGTTATDATSSPTNNVEPTNPNALALPFEDGWISRDANQAGIQGSFYTFTDEPDGGTSTIAPADFSMSGSESICAQGQAAQVLNGEFDRYWGAAVGFNLHQEEGDDTAYAWDATAVGVTGFGFVVDELPAGGQLRFNLKAAGDDHNYCATITAVGYNEFRFADLRSSCWTVEEGTPDYTSLEALHWQFVTNESSAYDFSLCVSGLSALTD